MLEVIGAGRREQQAEEAPQDAVLVEARHVVEGAGDLSDECRLLTRIDLLRVEAHLEEVDEQPHDVDVRGQRGRDVGLAERRTDLAQVRGIGPEHDDLAPGQAGGQDEPVEGVALHPAGAHRSERFLERLAHADGFEVVLGPVPQSEVIDPGARTIAERPTSYGRSSVTSTPMSCRLGMSVASDSGGPTRRILKRRTPAGAPGGL